MALMLFNTLSKTREEFAPIDPAHVRLYVCGPTVYDRAHLGNARPVIVFDVLSRLLRRHYPHVTYVRNITDVDDKINTKAAEMGVSIRDVTETTVAAFHADMAALGALPPDVEPRATDNIGPMIDLISRLIARGHAYEAEGHVLFEVRSNPQPGILTGNDLDGLRAGARVEQAPFKRDPADFVLWKPSPAGWPAWDSPWGAGRPGWHIECSAMAWKELGETFDLHGGGGDLAFPHHENEIAQSTCAFGSSVMANYWLHNGMLLVDGRKMSKSLGNFVTVEDILRRGPWAGAAFRLLTLKTHYRGALDFTIAALDGARRELDKFMRVLEDGDELEVPKGVEQALMDDLNTPLALTHLHGIAFASSGDPKRTAAKVRGGLSLLGLPTDAEAWFRSATTDEEARINGLVEERRTARERRDFKESDRLRSVLESEGIVLEDSRDGTTWRRA